ncbi:MAG: protein TolQ [Sinobacteraceae bacterium]|nr:protein TolQ [Nevskia sp.]MDI3259786.1 protein TolQ [Nevskiaceae bacterium]
MTTNISFLQLVLQAGTLVQIILGLLVFASILSWAVILQKRSLLDRTQKAAIQFENRFWSGGTLSDLYESLRRGREADEGLAQIFRAGYEEFIRQSGHANPDDALAAVQRQMRVAHARELERLEGGLSLLATVGSTSPYVGLFGTVWGIMTAFIAIGNVKQATLASVAPGIAEALIATAMGLFAAIPAVIAYNFFTARVERLENRFGTFAEELTGILDRGLRTSGTRAS